MTEQADTDWAARALQAGGRFMRRLKADPTMAAARQDIATSYRRMRAINPSAARLLWRKMKATERDVAQSLLTQEGEPDRQGLASLLQPNEEGPLYRFGPATTEGEMP